METVKPWLTLATYLVVAGNWRIPILFLSQILGAASLAGLIVIASALLGSNPEASRQLIAIPGLERVPSEALIGVQAALLISLVSFEMLRSMLEFRVSFRTVRDVTRQWADQQSPHQTASTTPLALFLPVRKLAILMGSLVQLGAAILIIVSSSLLVGLVVLTLTLLSFLIGRMYARRSSAASRLSVAGDEGDESEHGGRNLSADLRKHTRQHVEGSSERVDVNNFFEKPSVDQMFSARRTWILSNTQARLATIIALCVVVLSLELMVLTELSSANQFEPVLIGGLIIFLQSASQVASNSAVLGKFHPKVCEILREI